MGPILPDKNLIIEIIMVTLSNINNIVPSSSKPKSGFENNPRKDSLANVNIFWTEQKGYNNIYLIKKLEFCRFKSILGIRGLLISPKNLSKQRQKESFKTILFSR